MLTMSSSHATAAAELPATVAKAYKVCHDLDKAMKAYDKAWKAYDKARDHWLALRTHVLNASQAVCDARRDDDNTIDADTRYLLRDAHEDCVAYFAKLHAWKPDERV